MRVSPIGFLSPVVPAKNRRGVSQPIQKMENINFKGGATLKLGDYIAGAICGTAMAVVGFAVGGPVGAIALGALGAKATAEANNETRNDN